MVLLLYHPNTPISPSMALILSLDPLFLTCPFTTIVGEVHGRPGSVIDVSTYSVLFLSRTDTSTCTPATGPFSLRDTYA